VKNPAISITVMRDIEEWLGKFRKNWELGNIDKVLELFTEDVDYHETPFQQIKAADLRSEWEGVKNQNEIDLEFDVFSSNDEKYTVQWSLEYTENGERNRLKGIYLIKLNENNKCYEFWQYCEVSE
jgi:ketosteroid isomerase-like protein